MADSYTITVDQADDIIPEVIAQEALGMLEADCPLIRNVTRDSELTPAKEGDTIRVTKRGTVEAKKKVKDTKVTMQRPSTDKVDIKLTEHYEVTFAIEDMVKSVQDSKITLDLGYIADGIISLRETIEEKLAALASSFTNSVGAVTTDVDNTQLLECRKKMTDNRAPQSDRALVLSSGQTNSVLTLDKFTDVSKYGPNQAVQEGVLGRIYKFNTFESLFNQSTGGSPAGVMNMAFHKWALVLASRPVQTINASGVQIAFVERDGLLFRVIIGYNQNYLATQITIDSLFGVGVMRPELGVKLLSQD